MRVRHARFVALQRALLDLVAPELRRAFRTRRYSDVLAFLALLKRSVSTVEACRSTLGVVAERLQQALGEEVEDQETRRQRLRTLRDYHRKIERFGAGAAEEERQQQLLEAENLARQLAALEREVRREARTLTRATSIVGALDELVAMAAEATGEDPKLEQLVAEVQEIRRAEPATNILVYTEYVDSQRAAARGR
jgi:ERCC4-related helicase